MLTTFLIILMIILVFVVAMLPRYNKNVEDFVDDDDVMGITESALRFEIPDGTIKKQQEEILRKADTPLPVPKMTERIVFPLAKPSSKPPSQSQVRRDAPKPQAQAQASCACDCDALKKQINSGCFDIQQQLDQCNTKLLNIEGQCEAEKGIIEQQNQQRLNMLERELQMAQKEATEATINFEMCNSKMSIEEGKNSSLMTENSQLRQQIIDIQGMISQSGKDTGVCQKQYEALSSRYDDLSARYVQTADQYNTLTTNLNALSDAYAQLKAKVDQCARG